MSLGIAFKGPEGIVLAADSRVTLTATLNNANSPGMVLPCTYDNATKLLRVNGQDHVGAITYGVGSIGALEPRTAHSFIPEFESKLKDNGSSRLSVEDFANKLSEFFLGKWTAAQMPNPSPDQMIFLIGGYDSDAPYGKLFEFHIPNKATPMEWHGAPGTFGAVWGGQHEFVHRLINGFDDQLLHVIKNEFNLNEAGAQDLRQKLAPLSVQIPYQFLSLQDCIDLSIFLIRSTITLQTWQVGLRGVGGAIDVATITPIQGFQYVQQKTIRGEMQH